MIGEEFVKYTRSKHCKPLFDGIYATVIDIDPEIKKKINVVGFADTFLEWKNNNWYVLKIEIVFPGEIIGFIGPLERVT